MRLDGSDLVLSPTDVSSFLSCRHLTALEMARAHGKLHRPHRHDPLIDALVKRGKEHEARYVESLRSDGRDIVDLSAIEEQRERVDRTLDAMRRGVGAIVQGALADKGWYGNPDVMLRVDAPSVLGGWSYEIADTKLARETRAGAVLQLGVYSSMLALAQGYLPASFHVVTPGTAGLVCHSFPTDDYAAYVRLVQRQLVATSAIDYERVAADNYPDPIELCEVCNWRPKCNDKRRDDDHLSLVAGITRLQRRMLGMHDVATTSQLAALPIPLPYRFERGSPETYVRVREQARLQIASHGRTVPCHELREVQERKGLLRLPEPSPGDVFLDLEGDPFAREGGREYLFGIVTQEAHGPQYHGHWSFSDREERAAAEWLIDLLVERARAHPGMHVYHYAPYEPAALKRLVGRYASRESELDTLLRAERFIDLYAVVREGLQVGTERYSIKNLEPLYAFARAVPLDRANAHLRIVEQALEQEAIDLVPEVSRAAVEGYNKDDCVSTLRLRDWLEGQRATLRPNGVPLARPAVGSGEPTSEQSEREAGIQALRAKLLVGVSPEPKERAAEAQARWLLAYLLDYHRREDKATWWEYFRLRDLPEEDLADEPHAIAGLRFVERVIGQKTTRAGKLTGPVTDRYSFPPQETGVDKGSELKLQDERGTFGKVVSIDRAAGTIDVRKAASVAEEHPTAAFAHTYVNPRVLEDAIFRIAARVAEEGAMNVGPGASARAARSLLIGVAPRLRSGAFRCERADIEVLKRIVLDLDESVLAVQGPPGAGKTHCGARMICAAVAAGMKVGVTATGHKVIRNLLDAVGRAARETEVTVSIGQKVSEDADDDEASPGGETGVTLYRNNALALDAIRSGTVNVLGGTAWLWARQESVGALDLLFVDEAGQMSLANVVAVSGAAKSVVLLGDPQQLEQPRKGTHPDGVGVSALQHILGARRTVPPELGVFLPETWRLAPAICDFTSRAFYEGKLTAKANLARQGFANAGFLDGAGLWFVDVDHDGNRNCSDEEVDAIAALVERIMAEGAEWTDANGVRRPLTRGDFLVVAPYNAQVARLAERFGRDGVRVGTVDRFQGQEAPVSIYSMATSRPEDAPRGMEFLYSLNRLNVATSRARGAAIVVASPRLYEPQCRSPRQMQLANALCRFREMARPAGAPRSESIPTPLWDIAGRNAAV